MACFFFLRRAYSLSLIRSVGSSSQTHLFIRPFGSCDLPFPAVAESEQGISCKRCILDGVPFDSIQRNVKRRILMLKRNTNDEIIKIQVAPKRGVIDSDCFRYYDDEDDDEMTSDEEAGESNEVTNIPPLVIYVKILYGNNFRRCFEAFCHAFPNDHDRIAIRHVSFRNTTKRVVSKNAGRDHLEEFEEFFEKRGIEHCNLNFLFNYIKKTNEMQKDHDFVLGASSSQKTPENGISSYPNVMAPLPCGVPFELKGCCGSMISMKRRYEEENIEVVVEIIPPHRFIGDDPYFRLRVYTNKWNLGIMSIMYVLPDRLDIRQVAIRFDEDMENNLEYNKEYAEHYKKYLKSKGITSKTIHFLYNRLGYTTENLI